MSRERIKINLDAFMRKNFIPVDEMVRVLGIASSTVSVIRGRGYVYEPDLIQTILDQDRGWDVTPLFEKVDPDDMRYDAAIYRMMLRERDSRIVELTKRIALLERTLDQAGVAYKK